MNNVSEFDVLALPVAHLERRVARQTAYVEPDPPLRGELSRPT